MVNYLYNRQRRLVNGMDLAPSNNLNQTTLL